MKKLKSVGETFTVVELIAHLQKYDAETPVVIVWDMCMETSCTEKNIGVYDGCLCIDTNS
jgi:hypothetical protein